jgi:hypothetical protein
MKLDLTSVAARTKLLEDMTRENVSLTESPEFIAERAMGLKNKFRSNELREEFSLIPQWYKDKMEELGKKLRKVLKMKVLQKWYEKTPNAKICFIVVQN